MKKFALLLFAALTSLSSFAQQLVSADNSQHTLLSPPAFPGGDSAMLQFLSANIMYPKLAKENKELFVKRLNEEAKKQKELDEERIKKLDKVLKEFTQKSASLSKFQSARSSRHLYHLLDNAKCRRHCFSRQRQ